ncbi:MAG: cation-transporting P-type ATPase [Firmicutes bacterium]|nr:cation-transporting P-type ATPase [Bacillota bacterium]
MAAQWQISSEGPISQLLQSLKTDPDRGLTTDEARKRLAQYGPNRLVEPKQVTFIDIFWEEVREPLILLLLVIAVLYSIWGNFGDFLTIVFVVAALVFAEVYNEYRAKRSISALQKLSAPLALVIRDGRPQEIKTEDLVPGDILLLRVGERVQADARLVESYGLEVDESALTGESVPVIKDSLGFVPGTAPLAEQKNKVFAGTVITRGRGKAAVIATGMNTELGRITGLVREAKEPKTPLQLAMRELSGYLIWVAVGFSLFIPVAGILQGRPLRDMVLTGLSLAFATVPEEMPIIITMVLGLGALQLAQRHALVKRLRAAETLGSVTLIATDKTGTLTENHMLVSLISTDSKITEFTKSPLAQLTQEDTKLLEIGVLINDAVLERSEDGLSYMGDPTDVALVEASAAANQNPEEVRHRYRLVNEFSFDQVTKLMSGVFERGGRLYVFAKGAPESILDRSVRYDSEGQTKPMTPDRKREVLSHVSAMAQNGLRVIAFAYKKLTHDRYISREAVESGLTFVGIVGLLDPPRQDVPQAIAKSKHAGIRVIMITGDYAVTAEAISKMVGIDTDARVVTSEDLKRMSDEELGLIVKNTSVFARITPADKLRIIRAEQRNGEIVAVTGDGINDAPALSQANIGIAMGETGTDVAREAADMVLTDDNFATIAFAVRGGRRIFDNLRKGVRYYLAVKTGLITIFLLPIILGVDLPFAPIQIIVLELFMDLGASAAFVAEPEARDIMDRPPRDPKERFMNRAMISGIITGGLVLFVAVTSVFLYVKSSTGNSTVAQTSAFATWIFTHIFLAFNMRSDSDPLMKLGLFSNKPMVIWALAAIGLVVFAVLTPFLHPALKLAYLSAGEWILAIGAAFISTFWMEVRKMIS